MLRTDPGPAAAAISRQRKCAAALVAALAVLVLASCAQLTVPQDADAFAKRIVTLLQANEIDAVEALTAPSVRNADPYVRAKIQKIAPLIPKSMPDSVAVTGWQINYKNGVRSDAVGYEYRFGEHWLIANFLIERADGELRVAGFSLTLNSQSLHEKNALLRGKSFLSYLFASLWIGLLALMIYALVVCFRTSGLKHKWLWMLFIAAGFGRVSLNWTDETLTYQLASVFVPVVTYAGGGYTPIVLVVALPLGALIFLGRRSSPPEPSEPAGPAGAKEGAQHAPPAPPAQNA
jgi:hypothetical protein